MRRIKLFTYPKKKSKAIDEVLRLISSKNNFEGTIVGLLNFIRKTIPTGRAFLRRFYDSFDTCKQWHARWRHDLSAFLTKFNGLAMFNDKNCSEVTFIELYIDAPGNSYLGCGCYFKGQWCAFNKWPEFIFKGITYLELVRIVLAIGQWNEKQKGYVSFW
jgi:hypothetical protein